MRNSRFHDIAEQATKSGAAERRVVSPVARKVGGCVTIILVLLFTSLGVAATILLGRMGGNVDTIGPVAVGVGLFGGIVVGALSGVLVRRLLHRLLIR